MTDKTRLSGPNTMATKETQEHIWDIEDELDDAKSTIQSQATQIQLQKDQLKRLRLALRAKEHEISELKDESTAANTIDTEQKNIKDERLIAESAMFQEADDIREQIIEVGDPEIQTIQIPNQAGRIEHRGDKASDETHNVLTQVKLVLSLCCMGIAYSSTAIFDEQRCSVLISPGS